MDLAAEVNRLNGENDCLARERVAFLVAQARFVLDRLALMGITSPACSELALNLALALQYFDEAKMEEKHGNH